MRARRASLVVVAVAAISCSSSDGSGGGDDGAAPSDSSATETGGSDAHGDGTADATDSSLTEVGDGGDATATDGDATDAPASCAPTTTWVQQTTLFIGADADVDVAFDCDGVYTLTPVPSPRGYALQKWNQSDGGAGWKADVFTGDDAVSSAMVRAGDGLYLVMLESANLEKRDPKTGALAWDKTEPDVHAFCQIAANDTTLFTTTEVTGAVGGSYTYRIDARSIADGSILWSAPSDDRFCNGGTIGHMDALVVTKDGIFTAGSNLERRSLVDGALVWTASKSLDAVAFAVGDASVYVAGSASSGTTGTFDAWDLQQFDLATGKLGWEQKWNSSTTGNDTATMATFGHGALFVGGMERTMTFTPAAMRWEVDRLDPSTGKVTWAQRFNPAAVSSALPTDGLTDGTSVYLAGVGEGNALRVEKRRVSDGTY